MRGKFKEFLNDFFQSKVQGGQKWAKMVIFDTPCRAFVWICKATPN